MSVSFNDVYRVSQKYVPQPGAPSLPKPANNDESPEITVSQFAQQLYDIRDKWDDAPNQGGSSKGQDEVKEGLVLFAGDVFNPSVESAVTRGSHMVSPVDDPVA
jgi:5'-nucleotidase